MADLTPAAPGAGITLNTLSGGQNAGGQTLSLLGPAQILQLPDKLQSLQRSVLLGAQVGSQNPDGSLTLKTAAGDIVVRPSLPLPAGQQTVSIQIQSGQPPTVGALFLPSLSAPHHPVTPPLPMPVLPSMPSVLEMEDVIVSTGKTLDPESLPPVKSLAEVLQTARDSSAILQSAKAADAPIREIVKAIVVPSTNTMPQAQAPVASSPKPAGQTGTLPTQIPAQPADNFTQNASLAKRGDTVASGQASLSGKTLETVQQTVNLLDKKPVQAQAQSAPLQAAPGNQIQDKVISAAQEKIASTNLQNVPSGAAPESVSKETQAILTKATETLQNAGLKQAQNLPPAFFSSAPSMPLLPAAAAALQQFPAGSQLLVQILQLGENIQMADNAAPSPNAQIPPTQIQTPIPANIAADKATLQQAGILINNEGVVLEGKVISIMPNGQIIVATDKGNLALPVKGEMPVAGDKILLQWMEPVEKNLAALTLKPLDAVQGKEWPALQALLQTLSVQDPASAQAALNIMPRMNQDFPVAALFFLMAIRSGDVKNWLGDKAINDKIADALKAMGKGDILEALKKDFAALPRSKIDTLNGEWKLYPLPILDDKGLNRIQLAVRDYYEPVDSEDEKSENTSRRITHFLVDVDFSAFGSVQLEGFMRDKKLDVIVRSQTAFPQDMRQELSALYTQSLELQGLNGTLSFQSGYQGWVRLMARKNASSYSA